MVISRDEFLVLKKNAINELQIGCQRKLRLTDGSILECWYDSIYYLRKEEQNEIK